MTRPFPHLILAGLALTAVGTAAPALACDPSSATDISCGYASTNPFNPWSPYNPANQPHPLATQQDPATDPGSPYFSRPVYADGILSLFEQNPRIIYPAGPPQTCCQGLDCPAGVTGPLAGLFGEARATAVATPADAVAPVARRHRRHPAGR